MEWEGFVPQLQDASYVENMRNRMQDRLDYVQSLATEQEGYNQLPEDAAKALENVVSQANAIAQ